MQAPSHIEGGASPKLQGTLEHEIPWALWMWFFGSQVPRSGASPQMVDIEPEGFEWERETY